MPVFDHWRADESVRGTMPSPPAARVESTQTQPDRLPSPAWFIVSFTVYVALGLVLKTLVMNWIVGPLWLLVTVCVVPALVRGVTRPRRP